MRKSYDDTEMNKEQVLSCQIYILREVLWKTIEKANLNLMDESVLNVSRRMDEVLNEYCAVVTKRKEEEAKKKEEAEAKEKKIGGK